MPNANLANATTLVAEGHMPMEDHEVIVQLATEVRALAEEHRELTFADFAVRSVHFSAVSRMRSSM